MAKLMPRLGVIATVVQLSVGFAGAAEPPQYGGTLEIVTVSGSLSALSWDNYDFVWKHNHDSGQVYEQLFAADISKAKSRGGKFSLIPGAFLPAEVIRGELAEKWEWLEGPLRVQVTSPQGHSVSGKARSHEGPRVRRRRRRLCIQAH